MNTMLKIEPITRDFLIRVICSRPDEITRDGQRFINRLIDAGRAMAATEDEIEESDLYI